MFILEYLLYLYECFLKGENMLIYIKLCKESKKEKEISYKNVYKVLLLNVNEFFKELFFDPAVAYLMICTQKNTIKS